MGSPWGTTPRVMLMRRAGLQGLNGSRGPRRRRITPVDTPADLVDRDFVRSRPDRLWVTVVERYEAFVDRAVVGGRCLVLVAAGIVKLRAA